MAQKTDIEIAQACEMHPITEVAKTVHIPEDLSFVCCLRGQDVDKFL